MTMLILNVHEGTAARMTTMYTNEATSQATSLAESMLSEILCKSFDEETFGGSITTADELTAVASLGPDAGESLNTQFDDVDDYDGYTFTDTLSIIGNFEIEVDVYYVPVLDPETVSSVRTFCKKVDIFINNTYLLEELSISQITTY